MTISKKIEEFLANHSSGTKLKFLKNVLEYKRRRRKKLENEIMHLKIYTKKTTLIDVTKSIFGKKEGTIDYRIDALMMQLQKTSMTPFRFMQRIFEFFILRID